MNIKPPFTMEQLKKFKSYQQSGIYHEITCGGFKGCMREPGKGYGILKGRKESLVCPCGKYTRDDMPEFIIDIDLNEENQ